MRTPARVIAAAVVTAVLFVSGLAMAAGVTVSLTPSGPNPLRSTVALGDTVTFVNNTPTERELKSGDEAFPAATIPSGASHEYVATVPGTINYSYGTERTDRGALVVQKAGSVTLTSSSKSVTFGRPLTLAGTAAPSGFGVLVEERRRDSSAWTEITTVTPGADGSYSLVVRPTLGTQYRSTMFEGALRSPRVTVQVRPSILLTSPTRRARTGNTVNLRVRVTPSDASPRIELSLYNAERKSWRRISTTRLTNGRALIPWKVVRGRSRLRAVVSRRDVKPGLESATSAIVQITGVGSVP